MIHNVYAEGLFNTAKKANHLERTIEEFENFMLLAKNNPDWIALLSTPTIRNRVKLGCLDELGIFSDLFQNFVLTLIKNQHLRYFQDVYEKWIVLARFEQKVAYVQLYTAKKLTKKDLDDIREDIQPLLPNLEIKFRIKVDPNLIKGVKIIYQDRSIDRSIRKTLDEMKLSV